MTTSRESNLDTVRLDRIEEKIDKLSEAMIHLARAEEKLVAIERNNANYNERMNKLSAKLDTMQRELDDQGAIVRAFNKLFWIIVVALVGGLLSFGAGLWTIN